MRTLAQAVRRPDAIGTRIRLPWYRLENLVTLRTKELIIVAGGPGGGKSMLAVNLAMGINEPVLYVSQDSEQSVLSRMVALALGMTFDDAQAAMSTNRRKAKLAGKLQSVRPNLVISEGAHEIDRIEAELEALREWIGHYPRLVIIDNLIDLLVPGYTYTDNGFYSASLPRLKQMAIEKDCAVMLLHHVTRKTEGGTAVGTGTKRIRMTDLFHGGERAARHVLGVYNNGKDRISVGVLKQQDGQADPDGNLEARLLWIPEMSKVSNG